MGGALIAYTGTSPDSSTADLADSRDRQRDLHHDADYAPSTIFAARLAWAAMYRRPVLQEH